MPTRRRLLRLCAVSAPLGVAGCLGRGDPDDPSQGTADPTATPTTSTPTSTPLVSDEGCEPVPGIDGLPERPTALDGDTAETYVREFEETYKATTLAENVRIERMETRAVEAVGGGYVVELRGHLEQVTPDDGTAAGTATPMPEDALVWDVEYRIGESRVKRTVYGIPAGRTITEQCWTIRSG